VYVAGLYRGTARSRDYVTAFYCDADSVFPQRWRLTHSTSATVHGKVSNSLSFLEQIQYNTFIHSFIYLLNKANKNVQYNVQWQQGKSTDSCPEITELHKDKLCLKFVCMCSSK